jgi:hypothetical protein
MPVLGIVASQISGHLFAPSGAYDSIATSTPVGAGGTLSIEFTSIPSTYTHLQIRGLFRQANGEAILMQFNSDTASNYACHALYGDGATVSANGAASRANIPIERNSGMPTGANIFGAGVIDILDYANTNKYKTVRALSGHDNNGSGYVNFESGLWMSTSAITSIKLFTAGNVYAQYTQFALYGIKGA